MEGIKSKDGNKINDSLFDQNFKNCNFQHWIFSNVGAGKITFENCDFSYTRWNDAYFNSSTFIKCNFSGAKFKDSNLANVNIDGCDFNYSEFFNTKVNHIEMLKNLPGWTNTKRVLLHNLRKNAENVGDKKAVKAYLKLEIETSKEHLRKAYEGTESYYAKKYSGISNKAKIWIERVLTYADWLLWGHGEYPARIIRSVVIVLALTTVYIFCLNSCFATSSGSDLLLSLKRSFFVSFETFIGLKSKLNGWPDRFYGVQYLLIGARYLFVGLFISTLTHRLRWR